MKVRSSQLTRRVIACAQARLPVPVGVSPGIGSSMIVNQMTATHGHELPCSHPAVKDPGASDGLPFPTDWAAKHPPAGDLECAVRSTGSPGWLSDDLGHAAAAVVAANMQLPPGRRRPGDHGLPHYVTFPAATNGLHADTVTGCFDSPCARHAIVKAAQAASCRYSPDCNGTGRGQVVSGELGRSRRDRRPGEGGMPLRLPEPAPDEAATRARSGHRALRENGPRNAQEGGRA
jgi:hypothetical protein